MNLTALDPFFPPPASSSADLRAIVGEGALRRALAAMVRRRVPAEDAEDVVQAALCDALASERAPSNPAELARWIVGITKHKVADFHRRARTHAELDPADGPTDPPPFEARELLRGVMDEVGRDPRAKQTLQWVVRESAGERLADIAREEALPSAQVRQRVSRLRRWLRERWRAEAALLAVVLVFGAAGGGAFVASRGRVGTESVGASPERASLSLLQGEWRIASHVAGESLDTKRKALADLQAPLTTIRIDGPRVVISSPAKTVERTIEVTHADGPRLALTFRDREGRIEEADCELTKNGELVVRSRSGAWAGTVTLARAR